MYSSLKTESDYWIENKGERISTQSTLILPTDDVSQSLDGKYGVYSKDFIDDLSPDNIDVNEFWGEATKHFPLFSIAGGIKNFTNIEEVNSNTLRMAWDFGVLGKLLEKITLVNDCLVLEIGPGYGGVKNLIAESPMTDKCYYALDVNPLFEHPRIFKGDGRSIPDGIPEKLDIVYSMNVFQHLSKAQRTSYYNDIYSRLKHGGSFIFGMFVVTYTNKDWPVWGYRDSEGRCYTAFFRQLTAVDNEEEIMDELKNIGFTVTKLSPHENVCNYLTFECKKLK